MKIGLIHFVQQEFSAPTLGCIQKIKPSYTNEDTTKWWGKNYILVVQSIFSEKIEVKQ